MNPETQKSLATHTDEALAVVAESDRSADIVRFPVERVRTVSEPAGEDNPFPSDADIAGEHDATSSRSERKSKLPLLLGAGAAAVAGWLMLPRGDDAPAPVPETFTDHVVESAQHPYDPATDEMVIDGIRIKPGNAHRDTPSEAVLGNSDVKAYMTDNPDEIASLKTSSLSLPSTESGTYAVVERDVDNDGDTDAVAVPVIK